MINDELFNDDDSGLGFLEEKKKSSGQEGLYKIDLSKTKDGKPYRAVLRFLPNFTKDGQKGEFGIDSIRHFVDIKELPELSGYYDSPKSFGKQEKCLLSETFYALDKSNSALLKAKASCLNYTKKYYSYVLVLEDIQQPELVGKVMVFQYGKIIKEKMLSESKGEVTGQACKVFNLHNGKDFVLLAKENKTGDRTFPDYNSSSFKQETSSICIPTKTGLKNVPLEEGQIPAKFKNQIFEFLTTRDKNLEDFAPQRLSDSQMNKINEIVAYLTGKVSSSYSEASKASSVEDFDFEEVTESKPTSKAKASSDDFDFDDL